MAPTQVVQSQDRKQRSSRSVKQKSRSSRTRRRRSPSSDSSCNITHQSRRSTSQVNEYVYEGPPDKSGFSPPVSSHTGENYSCKDSDNDVSSSPMNSLRFNRSLSQGSRCSRSSQGYSSGERSVSAAPPSPSSDNLSGLTQSNPAPSAHSDPSAALAATAPIVVKSSNPDEEEEVWVPGASPTFVNLVKKVNEINNNPEDDVVSQFPSLLCDDSGKKPSVHRFPQSPYIKARKEFIRQSLLHDSRSEPASKLFPKPPPTLERVAEMGDKLEQKSLQDGSGMKLGVLRAVPVPHELWHDCLHDKFLHSRRSSSGKFTDKTHSSKVKFLPKQAKSLELSTIWSLKASNYIDNFLFLSKKLSVDQRETSTLLQDWAKSSNAPPDILAGFTTLAESFEQQKNCMSEVKDLFLYIVNNLVYLNTMIELSRRDDLQVHMSYLVSSRTTRAMRHSAFDANLCFSEETCEKAREEYIEGVKNNPNRGKRRYNSSSGNYNGSKPKYTKSDNNNNSYNSYNRNNKSRRPRDFSHQSQKPAFRPSTQPKPAGRGGQKKD